MIDAARSLWSRTTLHVWPESYRLVSLPLSFLAEAAGLAASCGDPRDGGRPFVALVADRDEVTLTIEQERWAVSPLRARALAESGPWRAITFDIQLGLEVTGYLVAAARVLAEAGISIVPQCGFWKDHLLVHDHHLDRAVQALQDLIQDCRS